MPIPMTRIACLCLGLSVLLAAPARAATGPLLSLLNLAAVPQIEIARTRPVTPAQQPGASLNFADSTAVDLDSDEAGRWSRQGDEAIWRLLLRSPDALNLSLTLQHLNLPAGGSLRLYDGDGLLWHGPIAAETLNRRERYWTPLVPGERLLLELRVPASAREATRLGIGALHHGYRAIDSRAKSGSCNVDVACPEADPWTDQVRSVARITIGGRRLCSAVLLNNTREDGDPLLLTANHCGVGESAELSAASVVVYWNYETSRCGGNPDGSLRQNQSGATLLASGEGADFSLLRLDQVPPASYQVYYAGWDASGSNPASGASLHHPSGDEKRISLFNRQAFKRTANVDGSPVQSWEVFWDRGITEPGSSGSGLWNSQRRVIGQLSGGNSSCSAQDASDVYGRLDVAWRAGSAATERLQPWLDPGNSGVLAIDGLNSGSGGIFANRDQYDALPADQSRLMLDVLNNDHGTGPLRLVGASARDGLVRIENNRLVFDWQDSHAVEDELRYELVDRYGQRQEGEVLLRREVSDFASGRGGALGGLSLLVLGLLWRRRRR